MRRRTVRERILRRFENPDPATKQKRLPAPEGILPPNPCQGVEKKLRGQGFKKESYTCLTHFEENGTERTSIHVSYHRGFLKNRSPSFVARSACSINEYGYVVLTFRIATTDSDPDMELLGRLEKENPGLRITHTSREDASFYVVSAGGFHMDQMPLRKAMQKVDAVAKVLLEAKEMQQCPQKDTQELLNKLNRCKR